MPSKEKLYAPYLNMTYQKPITISDVHYIKIYHTGDGVFVADGNEISVTVIGSAASISVKGTSY